MGPKRTRRPASRPRRTASARKRRSARSRRERRSFLGIWLVVMVVAASSWAVYRLWSGGSGADLEAPANKAARDSGREQMEVTLYFADDEADYLVGEQRMILRKASAAALAEAVLTELSRGPRSRLQPTIPQGSRVLRVSVGKDGVCTVDFSTEFQRNHPGGSSGELMTIYSVVQSLTANVPGVRAVRIVLDGKPMETLAGHISIGSPLKSDSRYIRRGPS